MYRGPRAGAPSTLSLRWGSEEGQAAHPLSPAASAWAKKGGSYLWSQAESVRDLREASGFGWERQKNKQQRGDAGQQGGVPWENRMFRAGVGYAARIL